MIEIDNEQAKLRDKLKTDPKFHDDILQLVKRRAEYSERHMNQRYGAWRKSESQHLAYVDLRETDKAGKQTYRNPKDIVVPYTYAIIQTRLTYFFFSMASKNPLVPISGRGPNDTVTAKIMEVIQDYQISETRALAVLYCFLQDCERYGTGIMKNVFYSEAEKRWIVKREPVRFLGYTLFDRLIRSREDIVTYEGNLPTNISPYNFLPDPRVNISDIKNMEFCGHKFRDSYNSALKKQQNNEYFNIDKIPFMANRAEQNRPQDVSEQFNNESNLPRIVGVNSTPGAISEVGAAKDSQEFDGIEMLVRLIPNEHKISSSEYPEEWMITIANGATVIKCEPSIYPQFNYYVGESNHDYASPMNLSSVDMYNGLADTLTWLFNSHMANVRKIINDSVIVDPSVIELKDLLSDKPVKIIRVKEDHWGRPGVAKDGINQLQISDITRGHINDATVVMNLIQRVSAATDNIMGMTEEVKRTATETSSTINLATARLKLTSYLYYILGIRPMFKDMVFNNQGLMTEERYYRITDDIALALGKDPVEIKNRLLVTPDQLYGNFDFDIPPLDMPIDKANMAKIWKEIITDVVSNPMLSQRFDIFPMFRQMVYNLGVNNIRDFELGTRVLPNEQVEQQAQAGNLVPVNQAAPVNNGQMQEALSRMNLQ